MNAENDFKGRIAELESQILGLQSQIDTKETEVNALYDTYITEAEGTAGTKLLGKGPVYKEKREKHDAGLVDLQQLKTDNKAKITATEAQIAQLKTDYDAQVNTSQPIIDGFDGLNSVSSKPHLPCFGRYHELVPQSEICRVLAAHPPGLHILETI